MKDYNVGDEFYIGRTKLQVKESGTTSCVGCAFQKMSLNTCNTLYKFIGSCISDDRDDEKSIIFVKIEKDERT